MARNDLLTSDLSRAGTPAPRLLESTAMAALAQMPETPFRTIHVELERAWAAGLFEGEGSFGMRKNGTVLLSLASTDLDVIKRFRTAIGTGRIWSQPPGRNNRKKRLWRVDVSQVDEVMRVTEMLYPWLGDRRRARADEAIEAISFRVASATAERICPNCERPFRPPFTPNAARTRFCSRLCERRFHWRNRWVRERARQEQAS